MIKAILSANIFFICLLGSSKAFTYEGNPMIFINSVELSKGWKNYQMVLNKVPGGNLKYADAY